MMLYVRRLMFIAMLSLCAAPLSAYAVGNTADLMCNSCVMQPQQGKKLCSDTQCYDVTNQQKTMGKCSMPGKCQAQSSSGGLGDIGSLLQGVASLIQALKGQQSSGSGTSGSGTTVSPTVTCTSYYQVSTPSSDPCAYYVPATSNTVNTGSTSGSCDSLSQSLGLCSDQPAADQSPSSTDTPPSTIAGPPSVSTSTPPASSAPQAPSQPSSVPNTVYVGNSVIDLNPGLSGKIQTGANGVTVFVNKLDVQNNSQISGFYGVNTSGGEQAGTLAAQWCKTRPWSTNFLSFLIPSLFFDSLCSINGYQVGDMQATSSAMGMGGGLVQPAVSFFQQQAPAQQVPVQQAYPQGEADIWAVPASARLGARVTVFWSAKNVTSCVETSPDGSFSQSSLSGGSATVPITGPTTYSIACTAPGNKYITNYVTVELAP